MIVRTAILPAVLVALLGLAGCAPPDEPQKAEQKPNSPAAAAVKWEYKIITEGIGGAPAEAEKVFNKLGEEGWELVTSILVPVQGGGGPMHHVFKRAKR